jgi:hypothetical protein
VTDRKVQLGVGSLETMDGARVAYLTEYLVGQGWLREQAAVACADWVAGRRDKLAETSLPVLERGQRAWRKIARVLRSPTPEFLVSVVEHRTLMRRGGRWLLASEGRLNRLRIYALRFTSLAEALEVAREVVSGNMGMAALPVPARDA